jgi:hypothetical protein
MIRINEQEISAGRIQSQCYHAGYYTLLPDNARAELRAPPRRPRILGPHKPAAPPAPAKGRLFLTVLSTLLIVAITTTVLRQRVPLERSLSSASVTQPVPQSITILPTPTPRAISPVPVLSESRRTTGENCRHQEEDRIRIRCIAVLGVLERSREIRRQDLHALNRELREVLRRIESGPAST